jgi:branched-chain amino acid transport system permease protein
MGFANKAVWVYLTLALSVGIYLIQVYLETSRIGYRLAGVREDEEAAQALGIPARRLKVIAVAISAALTSAGGTLWAQYVGFVDPVYVFSVELSIQFALNAIIGGPGTALGPFYGSLLITSLDTYLRSAFAGVAGRLIGVHLIIYGCLLIVVVRFVPQGLAPWIGHLVGRRVKPRAGVAGA